MLETTTLLIFSVMLFIGILLRIPLYYTLSFGFVLFFSYGLIKNFSFKELIKMTLDGMKPIGSILVLFVTIGALTASWRASGTISAITYYSSFIIKPESLVVVSFILCSAMSFITGSSFASAATIGVICTTMGVAMGANIPLVVGAVLSGAFFGDRTSPLSATVNLVSSLTKTSVFNNVDRLLRTAVVPFIVSTLLYIFVGMLFKIEGSVPDFYALFSQVFDLSLWTLIPPIIIIILSLMKVEVNLTLLVSLISAAIICIVVQGTNIADLPYILFWGYQTSNTAIAPMVDGGGVMSMASTALIIIIASTYSGLFRGTGLLDTMQGRIKRLALRTTPFTGVLATGLLTTIIACDQILSIMLTKHLCDELEYHGEALAFDLCNSSSIIAGFVPWSTVCIGILGFLNGPSSACLFAFFNYLTPLWILGLSYYLKAHPNFIKCKVAQWLGFKEFDDRRTFIDSF